MVRRNSDVINELQYVAQMAEFGQEFTRIIKNIAHRGHYDDKVKTTLTIEIQNYQVEVTDSHNHYLLDKQQLDTLIKEVIEYSQPTP